MHLNRIPVHNPFIPPVLIVAVLAIGGCGSAVRYIASTGDPSQGITYYVGGAGPIGNVGSLDVPNGLADAGYRGRVQVFPWQGLTHAGDQINLSRNRSKAAELASEIRRYHQRHPGKPIHIIALSAGTGIAAFALEFLPEAVQIEDLVYLGCSLSSRYDLTRALRRVRGNVYNVYSEKDEILTRVVWYTGTVDRASASDGVAGLRGFRLPTELGPDTERQYAKVRNVPWRIDFADAGYDGGHIDCTSRTFVRRYIAPAILGNDERLIGKDGTLADIPFGPGPPATQPSELRTNRQETAP